MWRLRDPAWTQRQGQRMLLGALLGIAEVLFLGSHILVYAGVMCWGLTMVAVFWQTRQFWEPVTAVLTHHVKFEPVYEYEFGGNVYATTLDFDTKGKRGATRSLWVNPECPAANLFAPVPYLIVGTFFALSGAIELAMEVSG